MTLWVVVPAAVALGLAVGYVLGVWSYAQTYASFLVHQEAKADRKVQRALMERDRARMDRARMIERIRRAEGDTLTPQQEEVVTEEVERILGAGPNGPGRRRQAD